MILYPKRSGTGNPVTGKEIPEKLVPLFKRQGFTETPNLANEKAAAHFLEKKLAEGKIELLKERESLKNKEAELLERERLLNEKLSASQTKTEKAQTKNKEI